MWRVDADPVKVLESKMADVMRAVARVATAYQRPVLLIRRHVEPLRRLLDLCDDDIDDDEFGTPGPPRSPAPHRPG